MTNFFYYFAYGSNLLKDRIRVQIKGAEYECNGVLNGFKLTFVHNSERWKGALATILENCGSQVWGCIWRVPHEFAPELDKQELGYHRVEVSVQCENRVIKCRSYQFSDTSVSSQLPSPHYKTVIVAGAVEHNLPVDYVKEISAIEDNGYKGRVEVDIDAIKHLNSV